MTQIYSKYFSCEDGTGWVDGEGCAPASVAQKFRQNNCKVAKEYNEVSKCRRWSIQYFKNFHCPLGGKNSVKITVQLHRNITRFQNVVVG